MILEIYIAFFVIATIFLLLGVKLNSVPLVYLSMSLFLFSSLVMANSGISIPIGTNIVESEGATTINTIYEVLTLQNNFFVLSYVYIFLFLPIIGVFSSILFAVK